MTSHILKWSQLQALFHDATAGKKIKATPWHSKTMVKTLVKLWYSQVARDE